MAMISTSALPLSSCCIGRRFIGSNSGSDGGQQRSFDERSSGPSCTSSIDVDISSAWIKRGGRSGGADEAGGVGGRMTFRIITGPL